MAVIWRLWLTAVVVVGLLGLWLAYAYAGLFRWLAEWEIARFDFFLPAANVAGIVAICVIPAYSINRIWRRRGGTYESSRGANGYAVAADSRRLFVIIALILGLVAAIAWVLALSTPITGGARRVMSVSSWGPNLPDGPVRLIGGQPDRRVLVMNTSYVIGQRETAFAHLNDGSGDAGSSGRFFVQMSRRADGSFALPGRDGILVRGGLPGTIRVLYGTLNLPIAAPSYVLYRDAVSVRLPRLLSAAEFTAFALIFALAAALQSWRMRRLRIRRQGVSAHAG